MISIQQVKPFTNQKYASTKNQQKDTFSSVSCFRRFCSLFCLRSRREPTLPHSTNGPGAFVSGRKGKRSLVDIISSGTRKVWDKRIPNTQMEQLKAIIQDKYGVKLETYWDFHEWSINNYAQFWEEIWSFYGVIHSQPYTEPAIRTGDRIIDTKWFPGAMLNYAENLLRYRDEQVALICADEDGNEEQITYAQMYEEVKLYAAAFKKHGLQAGDRLACYMSNRKEAIFAMLAATSMGAIFGGPLPFYGAKAVATIMQIMKPKFLLTVDSFTFNRVDHNILDNLPEIITSNETIEKAIIVPTRKDSRLKEINHIANASFLEEFLDSGRKPNGEVPDLVFEQFPFDHPIYINFTSGTTGLPKGLVHSAGTFLAVLRDYGLHCDLKRGDVILHMQPVGWNLWNLGVNFLAMGGTLLVYNGLPTFLSKTGFWDIMDRYKVAFAFLPTSIIDTLEKEDMVPAPDCKLEHLKILSIGASPVKLQNIDFILQKVKPDVLVGCLYGATEVIGVFSGFDLNTPVYSSEIQCPALGVDLKIFDTEGNSVVGKCGELVIATPTLSMPISVWNDENDAKMHENYLSKYPGVWTQNDEAWIDPATKGIIIIGRSDNTIKQHGERFVSEEIYWAIHNIEEIADSICVGQYNGIGDGRAVLFIKMKNGYSFDSNILKKIETTILQELTVFYIPQVILPVKDIPYNLNGKKMESLVKKIINTNAIPPVNNVRNPECLEEYCNVPQLHQF